MVEIKYHVRKTLTKIARKQNDLTTLTTDGVSTTRPPIGGVTPALVITYKYGPYQWSSKADMGRSGQ